MLLYTFAGHYGGIVRRRGRLVHWLAGLSSACRIKGLIAKITSAGISTNPPMRIVSPTPFDI